IGIGHTHEVAATSRIFTSLQYENRKEKVSTGPISGEIVTQRLPLTFGFETDATSWLVLRGSISQNIVIGSTKTTFSTGTGPGKATIQNSTTVNTGATLNFGKLKVDGMVGTTTAGTMNTDELL